MKKILLPLMCLMCVLASSPVRAEWKLIEFDDEAAFYVDDFFERAAKTMIWELVDYKKANKYGNLSAKILWEIDCVNSKMRSLMYSSHPFRMGIGEALTMDKTASEWEIPSEDSAQEYIFVLGCGFEPRLGPKT